MAVRRLLAATDFSERSERALLRAASLCGTITADLHILHVIDDDRPPEWVEREARQASALLAVRAAGLRDTLENEPALLVRTGDPFQEVLRAADGVGADLIAMGAHRKSILRDVFVGTTIERVVRTGHHPVLMVNQTPEAPYRRVLMAVDFSAASAHAVRTTLALGLLEGAEVILVHAYDSLVRAQMLYAGIQRERFEKHVAEEASEARRLLEDFVAGLDLGHLAPALRIEEGQTFQALGKVAARVQPDLMIVGTRGLTGAKRILLGSVADAVLRGFECDILAVPPAPEAA
jgi:universal stress protein E